VEALERLAVFPAGVVLADRWLPRMDSRPCTAEIRAHGISMRVMVMSATRDLAQASAELPVDATLREPFALEKWLAVVRAQRLPRPAHHHTSGAW
jgi:DNA-binding response OmpR family regulator